MSRLMTSENDALVNTIRLLVHSYLDPKFHLENVRVSQNPDPSSFLVEGRFTSGVDFSFSISSTSEILPAFKTHFPEYLI